MKGSATDLTGAVPSGPARRAIEAIGRLMERWDAARERPAYRWTGLVLGAVVATVVLALPTPEGLGVQGQRAAAVTIVMAAWWMAGVLPLAVTSLVPLVAFPVLGLGTVREVGAAYLDPLNLLMLGGFVLGHGMQTVGLHHRFTAFLLGPAWVRHSPRRVLLALMIATAVLSGLMSNTATMVMMLPLATTLAALAVADPHRRTAFPLGVAYAASIGGVATLIGTPPNAVLAGQAPKLLGEAISFSQWLVVGVPVVLLALPAAWWIVGSVAVPVPERLERAIAPPPREAWRPGERPVLAIVALAFAGWLFRKPIDLGPLTIPGWGVHVPGSDDAWVAMLAAVVLFVLPGPRVEGRPRFLLSWKATEAAIPWSVLLLLGGGFALAEAIERSGLNDWLAQGAVALSDVPVPVATLAICLAMVLFTEFASNTAAAQIAIPLLAAAARQAGVDPMLWMVPATIAASLGFMMPAGTAPNAIATEAGGVRPADMAYAGFVVNVVCVLIAAGVSLLLVPWMR